MFTAAEYDEAAKITDDRCRVGFVIPKQAVILSALSIAAAVMRPGVIEDLMAGWIDAIEAKARIIHEELQSARELARRKGQDFHRNGHGRVLPDLDHLGDRLPLPGPAPALVQGVQPAGRRSRLDHGGVAGALR